MKYVKLISITLFYVLEFPEIKKTVSYCNSLWQRHTMCAIFISTSTSVHIQINFPVRKVDWETHFTLFLPYI